MGSRHFDIFAIKRKDRFSVNYQRNSEIATATLLFVPPTNSCNLKSHLHSIYHINNSSSASVISISRKKLFVKFKKNMNIYPDPYHQSPNHLNPKYPPPNCDL